MKKCLYVLWPCASAKLALGSALAAFALLAAATARADAIRIDAAAGAVDVPATLAVGDTISLSLSGGQPSFSLSVVASPPPGIAGRSFIAEDAGGSASAVLKLVGGALRITIDDFGRGRLYAVRVRDGAVETSVREKAAGADDGVCGTCAAELGVPPESVAASDAAPRCAKTLKNASRGAFPVAKQKSVVDVLVAFDRGAKAWAESSAWPDGDTIEDFAGDAVDKMNMVLEKSQALDVFCYRLVGVVEVDATYDVINQNLLGELRLRSSGPLAAVAAAREKCGADTITLLVDRDASQSLTSGIGYEYLTQWTFAAFDAIGYTCNICDVKTVYSRYTMCHETGHNMGCGHSDRQGNISGPGCFPYSCGYHFVDAAGTRRYTVMGYSYTSPASGEYLPVPYFSSPDITSDELGVVVGTPTNDNRQTILRNCEGASTWREHVVPYDWDVRFLDDNGNDIPDATYFSPRLYVTLTHANPSASIYYTLDGSMPTSSSACCAPGTRLTLVDTRTITACAVVDGIAQSFRTVTFNEGHSWSGEPGQNGSGVWMDDDQSVLSWNDSTTYFYSYLDSVVFPDLAQNAAPTVTVKGVVAPVGAAFPATKTAYTFEKGTSDAMIHLHDARFAPSGDLTFNVPVKLDAVAFTNPANHTITFNAPFGQAVTDTSGYCTNMIGIGASGTLVVSPGAGCTQTFDFFSNVSWFYNNAQICVGDGAVVFKGPSHASNGLFGSTRLLIGSGGLVVFDTAGRIAKSGAAISGEGTAVCKSLATAGSMNWRVSGWEGTVHLTNVAAATLPLDLYGWRGSTVRLTGVSGYPGASGNTNIIFDTNIELVDAADGTAALTVNNGYSTDGTSILRLCGGGTFRTTLSPSRTYVRQGFVVGDASDFTGSLDIVGSQFTFGSTIRKGDNSQSGTIYVDAGHSVTNAPGAAWSAPNLVVNGELVKKGRLEILNSVTFGDGASLVVDALPADGVVLTSSAVTTNGALKVAVLGDDRPYVAAIVANGDSTVSLVFRNVPLPATVNASITVRHWGGDGWEDRVLGFDLPTGWVTNYYPTLDTAEAVAAKYDGVAANGAKVWQCYMLGLDPTDAASNVSLSMAVVGSKIRFSVEGLGETHALDGIRVEWRLKTSTDLAADPAFQNYREYTDDFPPTFMEHEMPDKPTDRASEPAADTLFYKLVVTFVAD